MSVRCSLGSRPFHWPRSCTAPFSWSLFSANLSIMTARQIKKSAVGKPDTGIIPGYVNSVCACVWEEISKEGEIIPLFSLISDHCTCMHCFLFRSVFFGGVERRGLVYCFNRQAYKPDKNIEVSLRLECGWYSDGQMGSKGVWSNNSESW